VWDYPRLQQQLLTMLLVEMQQGLRTRARVTSSNQSINYTFFQQERNPRREPLPNHFQWFLTGKAQTHKLGPDTAKTINAQALAWHVIKVTVL
jgi:hypothetical protein